MNISLGLLLFVKYFRLIYIQVVYNANELAKLVEDKKKMQNWLDYYQLKYTRNKEQRPRVKVNTLTNPKSRHTY